MFYLTHEAKFNNENKNWIFKYVTVAPKYNIIYTVQCVHS